MTLVSVNNYLSFCLSLVKDTLFLTLLSKELLRPKNFIDVEKRTETREAPSPLDSWGLVMDCLGIRILQECREVLRLGFVLT